MGVFPGRGAESYFLYRGQTFCPLSLSCFSFFILSCAVEIVLDAFSSIYFPACPNITPCLYATVSLALAIAMHLAPKEVTAKPFLPKFGL